jgi:hypothetical protein
VAHLPQVLPTSEKELHTLLSVLRLEGERIYDIQRVVESDPPRSGTLDASRFVNKLGEVRLLDELMRCGKARLT